MNTLFPLTKTAFKSLCLVVLFLFGGVSVERNSISLGTSACVAAIMNPSPAKKNTVQKARQLYKRIGRLMKRLIYARASGLGFVIGFIAIPLILLTGGILLTVLAINLFNTLGGFLTLVGAFGIFYLLIRYIVFLAEGDFGKLGGG